MAAPRPRFAAVFLVALLLMAQGGIRPADARATRPDAAGTGKLLRLWYDRPAADSRDGWLSQSLPLGNGYFGVNLFGGVAKERIQITENSLVDSPTDKVGGLNNFAEVFLDFPHTAPTEYTRDLRLNDSTAHVSYRNDGVSYTREYFTSYPDKVLAIRLTASTAGKLDFTLRPTIPFLAEYRRAKGDNRGKRGTVTAAGDTVTLSGKMDYYGLAFEGQFKVVPQGGTMAAANDAVGGNGTISVRGADSAVILIVIGTNYPIANPQVFATDRLDKLKGLPGPHDKLSGYLAAASAYSYDDLLTRHRQDYTRLFGRVTLDLGGRTPRVTTDRMIDAVRGGASNLYFDELAFQFGRYLLISSSRKGALPPNLQGVWNVYRDAPWTAGYWHNVNQQMNYWPAFSTNMTELFDSYIDFYRAYRPAQEAKAAEFLREFHPAGLAADGDNGWGFGNSIRPFEPSSKAAHSGFGTGAWTTMMFWDAYDFTRDKALLGDVVYPAMSGQAKFLSRLVQDINGKLLAKPSASPENANNLQSTGTTFDQQMIYENYRDTIRSAQILGREDRLIATLQAQLPKLDPIQIGDSGQIKEYREETSFGSVGDPTHRHISHLLGLHPGELISEATPAWLDAARVSLEKRGMMGQTGWTQAERVAVWARTGDGEKAYHFYRNWMSHNAMHNLWNNHLNSTKSKLFQVDGNFGVTAGVAEMLLQSQAGVVAPLAALPKAWAKGRYRGLLARGAFEVSADWSKGHATRISVLSRAGGKLTLRYPAIAGASIKSPGHKAVAFERIDAHNISVDTIIGQTYVVSNIPVVTPVAPVTALAVRASQGGGLRLDWQPSADATSFLIDRAIGDVPTYQRIGTVEKGTQFVDSDRAAASAKHLRYRVTAVSRFGQQSPPVSAFRLGS